MLEKFEVRTTSRNQYCDITARVRSIVAASKIKEGICLVFTPHTTAGITINENADPDVTHDMRGFLERMIPKEGQKFRHFEGNSDSHIKSTLTGPDLSVIVTNGNILLGRWQSIYFSEFDGPRTRSVYVKIVEG
jgi:secondary thiamine-phosphate synthase enzyme